MFPRIAILSLLVPGLTFAQAPPDNPKGLSPEERWLAPAQRLTATIDADMFHLPRPMQAVAEAHLAALWWTQDPVSSRKWAETAVDWVTHTPDNESSDDRAQRIRAARSVLSVVTPLDPGLRQRVSDTVAGAAANTPAGRASVSATMIGTAMRDPDHPDQLAKAISDSFPNGVTGTTFTGLKALREKNPEQADLLFQQALSTVAQSGDPSQGRFIMSALTVPANEKPFPEAWRPPAYATLARLLSVDGADPDLQKKRCQLAGQIYGRTGYSVDVTQAASSVWSTCQKPQPTAQQQADNEIIRSRSPKSTDDFLAVADELKDPAFRLQLKINAASHAEHDDHDLDRALSIFDGMTPDERTARGSMYRQLRSDVAVRTMLKAFEDGRLDRTQQIIETSPENDRANLAIQLLDKEQKKSIPRSFYELALRETTTHPPENPTNYIQLLNAFVKAGDVDAMGEVVKAADHWQQKDIKHLKPDEDMYLSPWDSLAALPLSPRVSDMEPATVAAKFALADNVLLRTDLQLGAIRAWIERYRSESEKMKRAAE